MLAGLVTTFFFFLFKNRFGVNIFYIINKNDFFLSFNTSLVKLYD